MKMTRRLVAGSLHNIIVEIVFSREPSSSSGHGEVPATTASTAVAHGNSIGGIVESSYGLSQLSRRNIVDPNAVVATTHVHSFTCVVEIEFHALVGVTVPRFFT
jgi:hypothetical protein